MSYICPNCGSKNTRVSYVYEMSPEFFSFLQERMRDMPGRYFCHDCAKYFRISKNDIDVEFVEISI